MCKAARLIQTQVDCTQTYWYHAQFFSGKFDFSKKTGVKIGAIKTTVIRLNEKGVITYYEATKGRNSSWKFVLSSKILDQYIRSIRGN